MKAIFVLTAKRTVADATAGVIPARIALSARREPAARPEIFVPQTNDATKMEYVIAFGVVAMMAFYVLIMGYCLRDTYMCAQKMKSMIGCADPIPTKSDQTKCQPPINAPITSPTLWGLATALLCNYAVLAARLRDDERARNSLGD
jgi:hypothetical protein